MSFLKTYQGQQETKGLYGDDYYSEEELPLLNKIIKYLPKFVQVVDNGNCIVFIDDNTSLTFDKELFDIDIQNEKNDFAWTYFYDVMFEKTNILGKEAVNLFSNIYDDLASVLPKLPNYKLYLIARKLRTMLSHSEYIKNLLSNKIELYYSKINKKLGKDNEYSDLILGDKLSKLSNLFNLDDENNINITIEEIMFLLKNGNINKYQLIDILKNDEKSINVLQNVLLSLIDYYLSDNKIISFFNKLDGHEIVEDIQTLQACNADIDLMDDLYLSSEDIFIYQKISFNNQIEL